MFILDPHGSPRAINLSRAHALQVMPMGADGKGKPSIAACFMDPSDIEGHMEDVAVFDSEAGAHAALVLFIDCMNVPGASAATAMEAAKCKLEEQHERIRKHASQSQG